ncbi:MAG: GTP-binding protein LepA, partial [Patescibacteria group bacterium]|nr:GTP-binding protein LepA [Patescibacteria group bacterium]
TTPTVSYKIKMRNGDQFVLTTPSEMPDPSAIEYSEEPYMNIEVVTPTQYIGNLMSYITEVNGLPTGNEYLDEHRLILRYQIPLSSILVDFYDKIKSSSAGYASLNYDFADYRKCDLVKMEILVAEEVVEALTSLVYRDSAHRVGKNIVSKLKEMIPRQQFVVKIQATIGGKVVAGDKISALRKDVTAKLYGGDVTRKRKLLEKQKKGKKRMAQSGKVEIPQEAYLAVLKRD